MVEGAVRVAVVSCRDVAPATRRRRVLYFPSAEEEHTYALRPSLAAVKCTATRGGRKGKSARRALFSHLFRRRVVRHRRRCAIARRVGGREYTTGLSIGPGRITVA